MAILLAELNDAELDRFLENFIKPVASSCATEPALLTTLCVDPVSGSEAPLWTTLANIEGIVQGRPGSAGIRDGVHYHAQRSGGTGEPHRGPRRGV
jgi:hypothetical protein